MKGIARGLNDLVDSPLGCAVGQVTAIESHASYGYLVTLVLRPGGQEAQARLQFPGARGGLGLFWPVAVDDEVLVVFPDGDINRAIAIPGVTSAQAKPPADWGNDTIRIEGGADLDVEVVADGVRLGTSTATDPVALKSLVEAQLGALKTAITGAVVVAGDGGASLKSTLLAALASWPGNTGASKVKGA